MTENVKRCPSCGESNAPNATYCRNCSATLSAPIQETPVALEGTDIGEWRAFIGNNADYYLKVFSKHEGKKLFFHINWAALFFNLYWIFYRKMYLVGVLYTVIWMLYSSLVGVAVVSAYIPAIEETHQAYAAYHQYMDYTLEDMVNAATAGEIDYGEVSQAVREYETKLDSLAMGSYLCLLASLVVFQVVFGLIANCLYRRYVERNIGVKDGGTSVGGVFLGIGVMRAVEILLAVLFLLLYPSFQQLIG